MTLQNGFSGSVGGAVWVRNGSQPTFNKIIFANNRGTDGGAIYLDPNTNVTLDQSRFIENVATRSGGGVYMGGSNLTAYNNLFDANSAQQNGGALHAQGGQVSVEHNTFNENIAVLRGGGVYNNVANLTIFNSILVSNTAGTSGGAVYGSGGSTTLNYNDIWNNSLPQSNVPVGGSSINVDPLFADDQFRLSPSSPALDIGWVGTSVDVDFEDDPRPIDQGFDLGWDELSGCRAKRGSTIYGSIQAAVDSTGPLLILVSGRCRGVNEMTVSGQPISQTVFLTGNMTIQGGWNADFSERGDLTPTFVDPEGRGRAFYISGTVQVFLEPSTERRRRPVRTSCVFIEQRLEAVVVHETMFALDVSRDLRGPGTKPLDNVWGDGATRGKAVHDRGGLRPAESRIVAR
jgi:predicted outer membrane repeat protein